jgi:hypothetical protein
MGEHRGKNELHTPSPEGLESTEEIRHQCFTSSPTLDSDKSHDSAMKRSKREMTRKLTIDSAYSANMDRLLVLIKYIRSSYVTVVKKLKND